MPRWRFSLHSSLKIDRTKDGISVETIDEASMRLEGEYRTPHWFSKRLSEEYGARVYLKREDLQEVRSYKIRGAYNLMSSPHSRTPLLFSFGHLSGSSSDCTHLLSCRT